MAIAETAPAARVRSADPLYMEIQDFLVDEVGLLNEDRYPEWLGLLTEDVVYQMPTRKTVNRRDGSGFDYNDSHIHDDLLGLSLQVKRNSEIGSAWDRDPAPRVRRIIGNQVVHLDESPIQFAVTTSFIVLMNRFSVESSEILSGQRQDLIRQTDDGLRLARRTVLIDQGRLSISWFNVFI